MPAADRQVIEQIYERWNSAATQIADDPDSPKARANLGLELFGPDAEIRQTGALIDTAGRFEGPEGMVQTAIELSEAFSNILWLPEEWIEHGDWLLVRLIFRATGRGSGIEQDIGVIHAWRTADGKITHFHVYPSLRQAREALDVR